MAKPDKAVDPKTDTVLCSRCKRTIRRVVATATRSTGGRDGFKCSDTMARSCVEAPKVVPSPGTPQPLVEG